MRMPAKHFDKGGDNVMVIGTTLVHAPMIEKLGTRQSVAAVAESLDKRSGRQTCAYRIQDSKIPEIASFGEMVSDVVGNFHET